MYQIMVTQYFDAAHYLRGYKGKCENLHGHRYTIKVKLSASRLNKIGLAYDFTDIKAYLKEILGRYDHTCLNDLAEFKKVNPSAENIAASIYKALEKKLGKEVTLKSVEAWETPEQGVSYRP
jgi:6-pyruvoyltetrahydropterin/6-carboxytetrahydropterin synthase